MPILFWIILAVWIVGIIVCFMYGGRAAPVFSFLLGALGILLVTVFQINVWIGVALLAVSAAFVWIIQTSGFTRT